MEQVIRFAADGLLLFITTVAGVLGLYWVVYKQRAVGRVAPYAVMAGLTSLLLAKLISLVYQPSAARPYIEMGLEAGAAYIDNPGFPSDHALFATVIVLMLYILTPYKKVAVALGGLVVVMGFARVGALVHTPLDVVGGIAVACVGAVWYKYLPKAK